MTVDARSLLLDGTLDVVGRLPWSSNGTFLVEACLRGETARAVYKPRRGERPLWDFPSGLHRREVAAYELSEALGWGIVPLTVERADGPLGEGSLQWFVPADFEQHYFTLSDDPAHRERLQQICVFDLVANNTDRKSGHCLLGEDGLVWAIDNGLSFHAEPKLRTVIWDYAASPVPPGVVDDVRALAEHGLPPVFDGLLDEDERDAVVRRAWVVVHDPVFPADPTGHRYPWPLV